MITDFEDFCTWVYVVVDDIWEPLAILFKRPGPEPECTDSELMAMSMIGNAGVAYGNGTTELLGRISTLVSAYSFAKSLQPAMAQIDAGINLIRQVHLRGLDLSQDWQ